MAVKILQQDAELSGESQSMDKLIYPEDGSNIFLRNVICLSLLYVALCARSYNSYLDIIAYLTLQSLALSTS
jgi:hypothetical protein